MRPPNRRPAVDRGRIQPHTTGGVDAAALEDSPTDACPPPVEHPPAADRLSQRLPTSLANNTHPMEPNE
jgi:hypothetical protein